MLGRVLLTLMPGMLRCDGQGRVMGGLGAVPGFGWWPIKAYRPCPGLEQAGIEYVRCVGRMQFAASAEWFTLTQLPVTIARFLLGKLSRARTRADAHPWLAL